MAVPFSPNVERCPFAIPIERYTVRSLIQAVQLLKVIVLDGASAIFVEETECDLILGVGLAKEVLEVAPVVDADLACLSPVGDPVEDGILFTFDFML